MYSNWSYDDYNSRCTLLKEKCKFSYCKQENNTENEEISNNDDEISTDFAEQNIRPQAKLFKTAILRRRR